MGKKYELTEKFIQFTDDPDSRMYQIRALCDFGDVKAGDLGGYISSEKCLSHGDNCWVYDRGKIMSGGRVQDNAVVRDNAIVSEHSIVCEYAEVAGEASVYQSSVLTGNAKVKDDAIVNFVYMTDDAVIDGNARVYNTEMMGHSKITDDAVVLISGRSIPNGKVRMKDNAVICNNAEINGHVEMEGNSQITGGIINKDIKLTGDIVIQSDYDAQGLPEPDKFVPRQIWVTEDVKPHFLYKHQQDGGSLYMVEEPVNNMASVSFDFSTDPDETGRIFVSMDHIIQEVRIKEGQIQYAALSQDMRQYVENGGKLYSVGAPKHEDIYPGGGITWVTIENLATNNPADNTVDKIHWSQSVRTQNIEFVDISMADQDFTDAVASIPSNDPPKAYGWDVNPCYNVLNTL